MKICSYVIVIMLCFCSTARSQVVIALLFGDKLNKGTMEFGIVVTPAFTNITNVQAKSKFGLNLGIYLNFWSDRKFFMHIEGIAKGTFGAKDIPPYSTGSDTLNAQFAEGEVTRVINSFSLPVLARYKITPKFFIDGGIQANMRLKARDIFHTEKDDNELDYTVRVDDRLTRLDFGLAAGLHYKFQDTKQSMGVGIRYFQGITDTHKDINGTQFNTAWLMTVTIAIGANKAESAKKK